MADAEALVSWWWYKRYKRRRSRKRRAIHVREIYSSRDQEGEFNTLFMIIKGDDEKFFNYTRMSQASFYELLSIVKNDITPAVTNYRKAISAEEKLVVTLRYLATGASFQNIGYSFRMGHNTVGKIVHNTCSALWSTLLSVCFPPLTKDVWLRKAKRFDELWDFKTCVGALDGKHVRIQCPAHGGSLYYNYKSYHSLQLQAVADADLLFSVVDVGKYGKNSDGAAFRNSSFGRALCNNELDLPDPILLENIADEVPYCFVADEAYPLRSNLFRPYDARSLNNTKRVFNQRLSRARKVVECTFGILARKWEIFQRPLRVTVEHAEVIVKAACALHNFVRVRDGKLQDKPAKATHEFLQQNEPSAFKDWEPVSKPGRRATHAVVSRERLAEYFMSDSGRLQWVNDLVSVQQ